jgi:dimethylargininase
MNDEGIRFTSAIVRPPADNFADGITTSALGVPDLVLARAQHAAYCHALRRLGVTVVALPPDVAFPDSTFVEDTAVVTRHGALIARPGAVSRRGEVEAMREALATRFSTVAEIEAPGTLDGGDVCQAGQHFFIGLSSRTSELGARQLSDWLRRFDFTATTIDIRDSGSLLHLKSGVAWLGQRTLVVTEALAGHPALTAYEQLVVSPVESYAANCVCVNGAVLMPAGFPELARSVARLSREVVTLDVSEFAKMDGGLSCLSIRLP